MKNSNNKNRKTSRLIFSVGLFLFIGLLPQKILAHCDSYDGPVIQDALEAIDKNDVNLVFKWIDETHEPEIESLFNKTLKYKNDDQEVYQLLERHFLETLVRLHREGEGEPYTGLKPAGSTKKIIGMTDAVLQDQNINGFLSKFGSHVAQVIQQKYDTVARLKKVKDHSVEEGRAYVAAYVDYTHTIEALHDILEHSTSGHKAH